MEAWTSAWGTKNDSPSLTLSHVLQINLYSLSKDGYPITLFLLILLLSEQQFTVAFSKKI